VVGFTVMMNDNLNCSFLQQPSAGPYRAHGVGGSTQLNKYHERFTALADATILANASSFYESVVTNLISDLVFVLFFWLFFSCEIWTCKGASLK
jgi:hypothetical protein